ncbi:sigma-70 family RNA polymerase sigma factor [Spirosoma sp. HMF4905]|uniref:Sigma-70 family RNA polymerase sigma factor n=1 Tax=Spirosoma arboris TaxID=2682092 RepID=A0A7K1SPB2_9BACT|nr:sigma-70 family RNA polymerase sigma factor [Spirosoma arboris]MVM35652.1 sigma-70 family RNA polymerase sigma factor [Spirosoma arboris]
MKKHVRMTAQPQQPLPSHPSFDSFDILYQRYMNKVYQQCFRMVKDVDKAQDYTQDIFIKAFHSFNSFQNRSSFSTWLYSITHNYCADQLRLGKRLALTSDQEIGLVSPKIEEVDTQLQEERIQVVYRAMGTLSAENQTLLRLKYEAGMSMNELAILYNLTPSTIKMRLKRSRDIVKKLANQSYVFGGHGA